MILLSGYSDHLPPTPAPLGAVRLPLVLPARALALLPPVVEAEPRRPAPRAYALRSVKDLTPGLRFGRWLVLERVMSAGNYWRVRCDCGVEREVHGKDLRRGKSRSCGCRINRPYRKLTKRQLNERRGR